jgi:hypothetical protein
VAAKNRDPIHLHLWDHPDVRRLCATRDAPGLLRLVTDAADIKQARIAYWMRVDPSQITRLVNHEPTPTGLPPATTFQTWQRIADALNMPDTCRRLVGLAPRENLTHTADTDHPTTPGGDMRRPALLKLAVAGDGVSDSGPTTDRRDLLRYAGLGITAVALAAVVRPESSGGAHPVAGPLESPLEITGRVQSMSVTNVDDTTLDLLDLLVVDVIEQYERAGPAPLAPHVVQQRRQVHEIMQAQQHPRQRDRLFVVAAELSGILAAMALDLGDLGTARAYAVEAFHLAQMLEPGRDLRAWVRATQSLIEYYAGRYSDALSLAQDGQRYAQAGPQSVRLAVNGEARALGRLGDQHGVDEAVGRARGWIADHGPVRAISASLSLGAYCDVRTEGNAATAYLSLGRATRVIEHGSRALATFDTLGLSGPRALTRLDLAAAHLQTVGQADPERAASLVQEALALPDVDQFRPVVQRAQEFLTAVEPWREVPAIRDVAEVVRLLPTANQRALP